MTREEQIINFVSSLRKWVAIQSEVLYKYYEEGREESKPAMKILAQIKTARHIASMFVDNWFTASDDVNNLKYTFLQETDVEIEEMISDYAYQLNIQVGAYGALALTTINLTEAIEVQGGVALPPGGGEGYILSQDGEGNYTWVKETTYVDDFPI